MGDRVITISDTGGSIEKIPAINQSQIHNKTFTNIVQAAAAIPSVGDCCTILSVTVGEESATLSYSYTTENLTPDGISVVAITQGGYWKIKGSKVHTNQNYLTGTGIIGDPLRCSGAHTILLTFFAGSLIDIPAVQITATEFGVTFYIEKEGGGDLLYYYSDGTSKYLTCTPYRASIALLPGTDSTPTTNYVWIHPSNRVLEKSIIDYPSYEHIPLGKFMVASVSFTQTYGLVGGSDDEAHVYTPGSNGHVSHINRALRYNIPGKYVSGMGVTISGSGTTTVQASMGLGEVRQLHEHTISPQNSPAKLFIINNETAPYTTFVTNIHSITTDATGVNNLNKWCSYILWYSHYGSHSKLYINKPTGGYTDSAQSARADLNGYTSTSIPDSFFGRAYPLMRIVAKRTNNGTTISAGSGDDLRGIGVTGGGSTTTNITSVFGRQGDIQPLSVDYQEYYLKRYASTYNPTKNNDSVDTAVLGTTFRKGDIWTNQDAGLLWQLEDGTNGAAIWTILNAKRYCKEIWGKNRASLADWDRMYAYGEAYLSLDTTNGGVHYSYTGTPYGGYAGFGSSSNMVIDMFIEVDITYTTNDVATEVWVRDVSGVDSYTMYVVSGSNTVSIYKGATLLNSFSMGTSLSIGTHNIAFLCKGNTLTAYINGTNIVSVSDSTLQVGRGRVEVYGVSQSSTTVSASLNSITIWELK